MIISFILTNLVFDLGVMLLEEIRCESLLGIEGLIIGSCLKLGAQVESEWDT